MILDSGICTIFEMVDVSEPGGMPDLQPKLKKRAWFGWLDFATAESWPTESREEIEVSVRIRIAQDRSVTNHNVVVLEDVHRITDRTVRLEVVRAFHGHDDENHQPITDLTLKAVKA